MLSRRLLLMFPCVRSITTPPRLIMLPLMTLALPLSVLAQADRAVQQQPSPEPAKPEPTKTPERGAEDENRPRDPMSTPTFNGLRFRSIGPAFTSGRVIGFAVEPNNPSHFFVASASGGVWKTVSDGTTWTPVFDREGSYSIGAIALDPKNPLTVWVGTGENNSQRSVSYGSGLYRSDDGGKTW